MVLGSNLSSN